MPPNSVWKIRQVGEIAKVISGYAFKSSEFQSEGIPIIKIKNIRDGYVDLTDAQCVDDKYLKSIDTKFHITHGDLLISLTGSHITQPGSVVGRVARYLHRKKSLLNQRGGKITITSPDECDELFLFYVLTSEEKSRTLALMAQGAASQANISPGQVEGLKISIPDITIQRKIATVLSAYDDLIENNTRRIKILEEKGQLIYCEWFTNFRFPGYENTSKNNSSLGRIPDGWKTVRTKQIVKRIPAGKLYEQKTIFPSGTVPVLDQGRSGIIGYHNDSPSVIASGEDPVIVFANHTCYQRIIQYPFSAIQNVLPFVPNPDLYRNIYWLHWATKDLVEFNDYKGHWPEFMSKTLLLPPENLCDDFGDTVKPICKLIYNFERSNINLSKTRDLLLPKLISGEIDVSNLDIEIPEAIA